MNVAQNRKWVNDAKSSIEKLMLNESTLTIFDSAIFGKYHRNVMLSDDVKFEDGELAELQFKKLRATRLKILGYTWISGLKLWRILKK